VIGDDDKPEYVMLMEPIDEYENWMPQGGADEKTSGNTFKVKITIKDKNDKPLTKRPLKIVAELVGVTKVPGVCLNQPLQSPAPTDNLDLKWEADKNYKFKIDDDNKMTSTNQELITEVTISAFDWAAFGKLKVTAEMEDGIPLEAHWKTIDGKTEIPIPSTTGDSHIADAFKKGKAWASLSDDDDNEKQTGNSNNGDGFTLFEEYRGVVSKNAGHLRLNPDKKDLVIENRVGSVVNDGMDLFTEASGIVIIELKKGSLPEDRVVNVNTLTGHKQYGIIMIAEEISAWGEALNISGMDMPPPSSPQKCKVIKIKASLEDSLRKHPSLAATINTTIAHEIAHACGVWHHGDAAKVSIATSYISSMDESYTFYHVDGSKISLSEIKATLTANGIYTAAAAPSTSSGNMSCIMRYEHANIISAPPGAPPKTYFFIELDIEDNTPGTLFCRNGNGTGFNSHSHQPYPVFGDAEKGNCMSQFKLKDW
jgi:hypothetical protein